MKFLLILFTSLCGLSVYADGFRFQGDSGTTSVAIRHSGSTAINVSQAGNSGNGYVWSFGNWQQNGLVGYPVEVQLCGNGIWHDAGVLPAVDGFIDGSSADCGYVGPPPPATNYISNECWTNSTGQVVTAVPVVWLSDGTFYTLPSANLPHGGEICWLQTNTQPFDVVVYASGDLFGEVPINGPQSTNSAVGSPADSGIIGQGPTSVPSGVAGTGSLAGQLGVSTNGNDQVLHQNQAIGNQTLAVLQGIKSGIEGLGELGGGGTNVSDAGTHARLDALTNILSSDPGVGEGLTTNWAGASGIADDLGAITPMVGLTNWIGGLEGPGESMEGTIPTDGLKWTFRINDDPDDEFSIDFNPLSDVDVAPLFALMKQFIQWVLSAVYLVVVVRESWAFVVAMQISVRTGRVPNLQIPTGANIFGKLTFAVVFAVLITALGVGMAAFTTRLTTGTLTTDAVNIFNSTPWAGVSAATIGLVSAVIPWAFGLGLLLAWMGLKSVMIAFLWLTGTIARILPG